MLKKVLSIILAGILLLTLTACSKELNGTAKKTGDEVTASQTISVISDQQKKEEIEVKNNAESLVYNSQKTLDDLGDKISGEEKAKVETEIEAVKKALETNNTESIKEATDKLTKVFYEMSEQLYKNANPNAGADPNAAAGADADNQANGDNGNVYDADYKVEEDNK